MKLIINGDKKELKKIKSDEKSLMVEIEQILLQKNLVLSHLIIDGVLIYQDYEEYLKEKIETVNEIEVITLELKTLIDETLSSAFKYISNAIGLLKPLGESFYQTQDQDKWNSLADLFEGIGWLIETMNRIDQIEQLHLIISNYALWNTYVQLMKGISAQLKEVEKAMVNKDQVLIGDLILYEILPIFELAEEKLRFLVSTGGDHVS